MAGDPMAHDAPTRREYIKYDGMVVGGGPAGCSAAVFTARYGLDTVVFDRGSAALRRCAYLENYLGFPAGIGVDVFYDLMHAHAREAGCDVVAETITDVTNGASTSHFIVETQAGEQYTAECVVAATWYDGSYLRGLDEDAMFADQEHHGEVEERFDPTYPDEDGRTPLEGLYVASPAGDRSAQAIVVAGHGAHVARYLLEDRRRDCGYSGGGAPQYDWLRSDAEFSGEWADRERWREWFENEIDDDMDHEHLTDLRERYIDRAFETGRSAEEAETAAARGIERLVDVIGPGNLLDPIDDERLRERARELDSEEVNR